MKPLARNKLFKDCSSALNWEICFNCLLVASIRRQIIINVLAAYKSNTLQRGITNQQVITGGKHKRSAANTLPVPSSVLLSQGPISGPRLSAQACIRGPIGSPRGSERPRGSRRIITLFISPSLTHPWMHTHIVISARSKHVPFHSNAALPLQFCCFFRMCKQRTALNMKVCTIEGDVVKLVQ